MVLTERVGKKRAFARGLLLTGATVFLYSFYWLYKAHDELFRQFELDKEKRDEGVVWLVLGAVLFPFQLVYTWIFVSNVAYLRQRLSMPRGIAPGLFVGLQIAAYVAFFAGALPLNAAAAEVPVDATPEETVAAVQDEAALFFLVSLVAGVILGTAYYRLQSDVNAVWDEYEARMRSLPTETTVAEPYAYASQAPNAAPPAQYTYWGDLRPPGMGLSAPHVRARADALVANHGVALPPELPDLLYRGDAGDNAALTAAVATLDELDRLLAERRRLHADLAGVEQKQGRLAGRLADGEVDAASYATAREELDRERGRIAARLAEVESRLFTSADASQG